MALAATAPAAVSAPTVPAQRSADARMHDAVVARLTSPAATEEAPGAIYQPAQDGRLVRSVDMAPNHPEPREVYMLPIIGERLERYLTAAGGDLEELRGLIRDLSYDLHNTMSAYIPAHQLFEQDEDMPDYIAPDTTEDEEVFTVI